MSGLNGEGMGFFCPLRIRIRPKPQENQSIAHSSTNCPKSASVFSISYKLNFRQVLHSQPITHSQGEGVPLTVTPTQSLGGRCNSCII